MFCLLLNQSLFASIQFQHEINLSFIFFGSLFLYTLYDTNNDEDLLLFLSIIEFCSPGLTNMIPTLEYLYVIPCVFSFVFFSHLSF